MQDSGLKEEAEDKRVPEFDPENPPLRPDVKRVPFTQVFRQRVAAHKAKRATQTKTGTEPLKKP